MHVRPSALHGAHPAASREQRVYQDLDARKRREKVGEKGATNLTYATVITLFSR